MAFLRRHPLGPKMFRLGLTLAVTYHGMKRERGPKKKKKPNRTCREAQIWDPPLLLGDGEEEDYLDFDSPLGCESQTESGLRRRSQDIPSSKGNASHFITRSLYF